jgi:hypothetical protein
MKNVYDPKSKRKDKIKDKTISIRINEKEYDELKLIARSLGDMPVSGMIRALIFRRLDVVRETGQVENFLGF